MTDSQPATEATLSSTADLADLVIVVAGAGGAAGPPLVTRLARAGATVVALDASQGRLDEAGRRARRLRLGPRRGPRRRPARPHRDGVQALAADVQARYGRVDGLAHLVGGWRGGAPDRGTARGLVLAARPARPDPPAHLARVPRRAPRESARPARPDLDGPGPGAGGDQRHGRGQGRRRGVDARGGGPSPARTRQP